MCDWRELGKSGQDKRELGRRRQGDVPGKRKSVARTSGGTPDPIRLLTSTGERRRGRWSDVFDARKVSTNGVSFHDFSDWIVDTIEEITGELMKSTQEEKFQWGIQRMNR